MKISFGGFELADIDFVSPILDGMISYFYKMISEFFTFIMTMMSNYTDLYSPTSTVFYDFLGVEGYDSPAFDVFITMAIFLTLGIFIVHIIILGIPSTEHKNTLGHLIFSFLGAMCVIFAIKPFLWEINRTVNSYMFVPVKTYFTEKEVWEDIDIAEILPDIAIHVNNVLYGLIVIVILLAIIIEYIKMILTVIERYIVAGLLHIASPVAAAMISSRTTISVFNNFIRMYLSQMFLLVMNEFFIFLSIIVITQSLDKIIDCLFALTFLRCAQQIDRHMKSLGLSVAQSGGSVLTSLLVAGMTMGRMISSGRKGLATVGSIAENMGAHSGNYALASVGTSLKNLASSAQGRTASTDSLNTFAQKGGLGSITHGSKGYDGVLGAATEAFSNGQYSAVGNLTGDIQTETVKNAMGANCAEEFKKATGLDVNNISSATVKPDGTINGTAEITDATGKTSTVAFTMGANARPGINAESIDGFSDGQSRYVSTSKAGNVEDGTTFSVDYTKLDGNMPITSTVTGATINSQAMANAGVTKDVISDGTIKHYRGETEVGGTDISTGRYYTYGATGTSKDIENTYSTLQKSGSLNDVYGKMIPSGASVRDWSKTKYNQTTDSVNIRWERDGKEGITYVSRPNASDIARGSKTRIYRSGDQRGDYSVTHKYIKGENVEDYHNV